MDWFEPDVIRALVDFARLVMGIVERVQRHRDRKEQVS